MANSDLTSARLRELFNYDPATGVFTRRISSVHISEIGKVVGTISGTRRARYIIMTAEMKKYGAHRLAWLHFHGEWPSDHIDHINGDGTDNRISNLRDVTLAENARNLRRPTHNTSGVSGVAWRKAKGKWRAIIGVGGTQVALGHFDTIIDAVAARRAAERAYGFHPNHGRS